MSLLFLNMKKPGVTGLRGGQEQREAIGYLETRSGSGLHLVLRRALVGARQ